MFDFAALAFSALPLVVVIGAVTWMFFYDFRAFRLSRVHDLKAEVTALEASLADGRGNAATSATLMQDAADTLAASTAEIARLKAELAANAEEYLQAESRANAKSLAAGAAGELLDRVSLELNQAHDANATLREFANTSAADLATVRVQIGDLRTAHATREAYIEWLKTQNQELIVAAVAAKEDYDCVTASVHAAALKIVELHADRDRPHRFTSRVVTTHEFQGLDDPFTAADPAPQVPLAS